MDYFTNENIPALTHLPLPILGTGVQGVVLVSIDQDYQCVDLCGTLN